MPARRDRHASSPATAPRWRCSCPPPGRASSSAELADGGYAPDTPCAVVYRASWPDEVVFRCRLDELGDRVRAAKINRQALVLVGPGLVDAGTRSHLYDPEHGHRFRAPRRPPQPPDAPVTEAPELREPNLPASARRVGHRPAHRVDHRHVRGGRGEGGVPRARGRRAASARVDVPLVGPGRRAAFAVERCLLLPGGEAEAGGGQGRRRRPRRDPRRPPHRARGAAARAGPRAPRRRGRGHGHAARASASRSAGRRSTPARGGRSPRRSGRRSTSSARARGCVSVPGGERMARRTTNPPPRDRRRDLDPRHHGHRAPVLHGGVAGERRAGHRRDRRHRARDARAHHGRAHRARRHGPAAGARPGGLRRGGRLHRPRAAPRGRARAAPVRLRGHGGQAGEARGRDHDDPLDAVEGRPGAARRAHRARPAATRRWPTPSAGANTARHAYELWRAAGLGAAPRPPVRARGGQPRALRRRAAGGGGRDRGLRRARGGRREPGRARAARARGCGA